jgi:hypothetical protein
MDILIHVFLILEQDEFGREFHTPTILTPEDGPSAPIETLSQSEINSTYCNAQTYKLYC